jgi:hypothetical protein
MIITSPLAARAHLCLPRPVERETRAGQGLPAVAFADRHRPRRIFGVGLGGSVEKLHWLPEAHTDFLLAVIGEEFGLIGVLCVIWPVLWLTRRIMHIGRQAIALDRVFAGLVAQGVGIWMGGQAFINMGVNLGALPTKGLTLPLMSYGGSAILINLVALASCCGSTSRTARSCGEGADDRVMPHLRHHGHGGGTGGHIFPGLAVARGAAARGWRVQLAGHGPPAWRSRLVPPPGFPLECWTSAACAARACSRWRCCRCACSRPSGRACRWCAGAAQTWWWAWAATCAFRAA